MRMGRPAGDRRREDRFDERPRPGWVDLVPAVPLLGIGVMGTRVGVLDFAPGERVPDHLAVVLAAVAALALLLRRHAPRAGFVVCGAAVTMYLLLGYPFGPVLLTPPAAAYAIGRVLPWRALTAWTGSLLAVTFLAVLSRWLLGDAAPRGWLELGLWFGRWSLILLAGAVLGAAVTARRGSEATVRAETARRVISEERLAMAREVHDGVGHGLAVIAMHAGVALHVFDQDPARARELLRTIQATSRAALDDLRGELDRLRSPEGSPAQQPTAQAPRRPRLGLADLPVLLDRMRTGGLEIDTELTAVRNGTPLPPEVDAAVYRIVQESLTNVLRHAQTQRAAVLLTRDPAGALVVEVTDDGRGGTLPGTGTGIAGMRQRAEAAGGSLTAGPRPGRGFAVRAVLPLGTDLTADGAS